MGREPRTSCSKKEEMTICAKCKYFKTSIMYGREWYGQFCGHPDLTRPVRVNPVTGEKTYCTLDSDGNVLNWEIERCPYARDTNKRGQCKRFESKWCLRKLFRKSD